MAMRMYSLLRPEIDLLLEINPRKRSYSLTERQSDESPTAGASDDI